MNRVFHVEPNFLVKHEQDQIVEEGSHVGLAKRVIPATCDQDGVIAGQEAHSVTKTRHGWLPLALELHEITIDDLAIDDYGLEITQLVLQFTFLILTPKEVNALMHHVTLLKIKPN